MPAKVGRGIRASVLVNSAALICYRKTVEIRFSITLKGKSKEEFGEGSSQYNDFEDRDKFTLQAHAAKPVCQVTLMFLLTRDTDTDEAGGVLLVVDSLDLQIAKGGKAKLR